ncbi:MAG: LuxR C-terminal-related transcriptional regulator [Jatrophihabitantaceae bacterium]
MLGQSEIDRNADPPPESVKRTGVALRTTRVGMQNDADLRARASSAELHAVRCADLGLRDRSIEYLREALTGYDRIGSAPDSARIRSLLRDLGVRVRHWTYEQRSLSGWRSLTKTEKQISDLVALGLTNREVAAEMFISSHTVGFHLRQVFRKLNIRSRVELARLTVEREQSPQSA